MSAALAVTASNSDSFTTAWLLRNRRRWSIALRDRDRRAWLQFRTRQFRQSNTDGLSHIHCHPTRQSRRPHRMGGGQQQVSISGVANLMQQNDSSMGLEAYESGYACPSIGTHTARVPTFASSAEQDPNHQGTLIGAFIFTP